MKIGTKIVVACCSAVLVSVAVGLLVQRSVIRQEGIDLTRNTMRAAILEAENVRESISSLGTKGAFDTARLIAEHKASGQPLDQSVVYRTIPVVAAWEAIEKVAEKEGFQFRVPKHQARNPKNAPTPAEEVILKAFEVPGTDEYFATDPAANTITYARPIRLTADCMACHGDPKNSATGDGKDPIGFAMEGWKVDEVHGAFVLTAKLDSVDGVVKAGMASTLLGVLPVTVLIAIGVFFLVNRSIARPLAAAASSLDETCSHTFNASSEISRASQTLADGASNQAASLEEAAASLEEISAMTKRNADNASTAKELASGARGAADLGATDVERMSVAMADIKGASNNIAKIIRTIDEIAFQTNILALNAAVEAARAGEAGMGFAVVADEVRGLAQRSAEAARETAACIEDSIQKSEHGVQISTKVAASFREIVTKTREVDELVAQIASASSEQSTGILQLNSAVTEIDRVTQGNAACAEEAASAAQELSAQARSLKHAVLDLRQITDGALPPGEVQQVSEPVPTKAAPQRASRPAAVASRDGLPGIESHRLTTHARQNSPATTAKGKSRTGASVTPAKDDFADF